MMMTEVLDTFVTILSAVSSHFSDKWRMKLHAWTNIMENYIYSSHFFLLSFKIIFSTFFFMLMLNEEWKNFFYFIKFYERVLINSRSFTKDKLTKKIVHRTQIIIWFTPNPFCAVFGEEIYLNLLSLKTHCDVISCGKWLE